MQSAAEPAAPTRASRIPIVVAALLASLALLRWIVPDSALLLIWLGGLTPWLFLPAYLVAAHALRRRQVPTGALASFAVVSHLLWVAPTLVAASPVHEAQQAPRLRVATANLLAVNARRAELLDEVLALDADVVVLQEVSPPWVEWLRDPRVTAAYPHARIEARPDAFGVAVLSRHPIGEPAITELEGVPMVDARVDVGGQDVRVLGVHTLPPIDTHYAAVWRAQLDRLARLVATHDGPLVVAGDLNSTSYSGRLRRLRSLGLRDAHDHLGRGLTTTWPNGVFFAPSMRLDHVLVGPGLEPLEVREGAGPGSDHRPVVVDLAIVAAGTSAVRDAERLLSQAACGPSASPCSSSWRRRPSTPRGG